jgi:sec-independent protein translocase protein TatB
MFDLAFPELIVIGIVALIVIGPEKLPQIARGAGRMLGQIQRYVNAIKTDINSELQLEDLQRLREELRQSIQSGTSESYQVGQVIDHTLEHTADDAKQLPTTPESPTPLAGKLNKVESVAEKGSMIH